MAFTTKISKFDGQEINCDALALLLSKVKIVSESQYKSQIKHRLTSFSACYKASFKTNAKLASDFC